MEPDQKPTAPDGSPADAQSADYNNNEDTQPTSHCPTGTCAPKKSIQR